MNVFGVVFMHNLLLYNSGVLGLLGIATLEYNKVKREHGLEEETLKDRHARAGI